MPQPTTPLGSGGDRSGEVGEGGNRADGEGTSASGSQPIHGASLEHKKTNVPLPDSDASQLIVIAEDCLRFVFGLHNRDNARVVHYFAY